MRRGLVQIHVHSAYKNWFCTAKLKAWARSDEPIKVAVFALELFWIQIFVFVWPNSVRRSPSLVDCSPKLELFLRSAKVRVGKELSRVHFPIELK